MNYISLWSGENLLVTISDNSIKTSALETKSMKTKMSNKGEIKHPKLVRQIQSSLDFAQKAIYT